MSHALIIGGTGMLSRVSLYLLKEYDYVTICARRPEAFKIPTALKDKVNLIAIDYRDTESLLNKLKESASTCGKIELAVTWIHDTAPEAPYRVACSEALLEGCHYVHVVGSAYGNPSKKAAAKVTRFENLDQIQYSQVVLGFQLDENSSRWLTHDEISSGVIEAIKNPKRHTVVGTVEPWERRP